MTVPAVASFHVCVLMNSDFSMNLSSVNKLTQLFPKLDGDLGSVGNHFTFDSLAVSSNELETPQPMNEHSSFVEVNDHMSSLPFEYIFVSIFLINNFSCVFRALTMKMRSQRYPRIALHA